MGKVSVAHVPQDVPGSSSREVFQGLFKDLGMQAMALEAILRAVCGRVDKLETWLTEVSFGMTELDLKLRNIAHNIDGTAAVDDEAQGPLRWAIPSTDDVKPLAATVSKKLGTDKKAVRVTGMAAAILDRLATAGTSTPSGVEYEKAEKSGVKKKNKEKKHGTKKVKANRLPDVPVTPSPAIVEMVPPPAIPLPAPMAEAKQVRAEAEPVSAVGRTETTEPKEVVSTSVPTFDETPAPLEQAKIIVDSKAEASDQTKGPKMPPQPVLPKSERTENKLSSSEMSAAMPPTETTKRDVPIKAPIVSSLFPTVQVERIVQPFVLKGTAHTTPVVPPPPKIDPIPTTSIPDPQPVQPVPLVESPTPPVTEAEVEASEVLSSDNDSDIVSASDESAATEERNLMRPTTPPLIIPQPVMTQTESQPAQPVAVAQNPMPVPSTPSTAKVSPVESPISKPSDNELVDPERESKSTLINHSPPPIAEPKVIPAPEPTVVVNKTIKATRMPIRAPQPSQQTKPLSSHDSATAEPAIDPLLPHRTSARRRSSKMVPRPSFSKKIEHVNEIEAARRLSGNMRGSHSRRTSIALPAQVFEHDPQQSVKEPSQQPEPQPVPTLQSIPQVSKPPAVSPSMNTTVQADINEESSESSSESSADSSESSADEEHEDDAKAGAAVEEISKTMTALKKLKRAHMLSPEEEVELKERAHKKWFQLKGHIKENQKKDVTNILLKRKKNVFTVSSRIVLLEEKSREIFAALKQITTDMREKSDRAAHETLRRRVFDIEQSLLNVDSRIASLSAPASEKVSDLKSEVDSLRAAIQLQLTAAQTEVTEATARHSLLEEALVSQRALVEALAQDIPAQLSAQAGLFSEKLKQLPDYHAAIENLKRSLRRKADLKLLKELEARLLGLDTESEDCLVRCLSCHKEVTHPYNEVDTQDDEHESGNGASQLRKVNPGPSSARIYCSNVPFNAQPMVHESILEESLDDALFSRQALMQSQTYLPATQDTQSFQHQSAGDSLASEKPPGVRVPSVKWSTPPVEINLKKIIKPPQASPLSLMNVTATRAILSPDRPISAPVVAMKKKSTGSARAKSLLKSLSPQLESPQQI